MRVAVLGGAGDVGSRCVEELARYDGVESITIIDRNLEAAEKVAASVAEAPADVRAVAADASEHEGMVAALRGHDIAASALGPFHRFEVPLVAACLDAGVDYASVCDEWEPTEQVFEQFGARAAEEGRFVLVGLGTSPGVTNVGVRVLAQGLDRVRRAAVFVYQPLDAGGGEAVIRHMLHIMTGRMATFRRGRRMLVDACTESEVVEFPRFGRIRLWNMGHAEPVTVSKAFDGIEEVRFMMGYGKGSRFFVVPAQIGIFGIPPLANAIVKLIVKLEGGNDAPPAEGAVRVDVWGEKDGEDVHRILCGTGQMREATGVSLAVGAAMVGARSLSADAPGVYAPEGCLDAVAFIEEMARRGLVAYRDLAMTDPLASG